MESDNNKTSGKVLVKDGRWCVPEAERPRNWREILPENDATPARTEARCHHGETKPLPAASEATPKRQHQFRGWVTLRNAIRKSAEDFNVEPETLDAAFVLAFGMFSRDIDVIHSRTCVANPQPFMERCVASGLWLGDGVVDLGIRNEADGDVGFWLCAMVASGFLEIATRDGDEPVYKLRDAA